MAENLITGSIQAPGFYGLDIQDSSVQLSSGFALEAFNCVIDKYGRVGARKGWTKVNTSATSPAGSFRTVHEFVKGDGNIIFSAGNNKIYGDVFGASTLTEYPVGGQHFSTGTYSQSGTTVTVTTVENHNLTVGMTIYFGATGGTTPSGFYTVATTPSAKDITFTVGASATTSGTANVINILTTYTITDDNWQVVNMPYGTGLTASAHMIWVQKDHYPLIFHRLGTVAHSHSDGYGFQRLGDLGNLPVGYTVNTFKPSCALSSYGRLWVAGVSATDTQTIYFSDLQNPTEWQTGTAGYLDISTVIPSGDPIVALAAHNGFLIIFCKQHIVVYENASDPANLTLKDVIKGVGCIARDSVASVAGTDLLFLSATGVQSFLRVVQEKSLPFRDVSRNVRDDLLANVASEDLDNIKAVYYPNDAMYLLALPTTGFTYCFDTRGALENGAARTTIWRDINPTAFCVLANRDLYIGQKGYVGKYSGYLDNEQPYRWSYYTNHFDMEQPTTLKILKKLGIVVIGGSDQAISVKWGFDYTNNYDSQVIQLAQGIEYEYGVAEYAIAEYSNGIALDKIKLNGSGTGLVLQVGFEADINGTPLSMQKIDIGLKTGKTL